MIRQWEPDFRASTTTFSLVVVWDRLPKLPNEYYDPAILLKKWKTNRARGCFARLCVQVNPEKPLAKTVTIGKTTQSILYEGISSLYFTRGRICHKKETCLYLIREPQKETPISQTPTPEAPETISAINGKLEDKLDEYGDWMVVTRRKPTNKMKDRQPSLVTNQSFEFPQVQANEPITKVAEQNKKERKRKVPFMQFAGS